VKGNIGCIYLNGVLGCDTTTALLVENVTVESKTVDGVVIYSYDTSVIEDWMLTLVTRALKFQFGASYGETCAQGTSFGWCCGKALSWKDARFIALDRLYEMYSVGKRHSGHRWRSTTREDSR